MSNYITSIRTNETIFRKILEDIKANDRGIKVPPEINPNGQLDDIIFMYCMDVKRKFFGITNFAVGHSESNSINADEASVDVERAYGRRHRGGVTLIYKLPEVEYSKELNRWNR